MNKTLDISCNKPVEDNIKDLVTYGNPHLFRLLSKASSNAEGWMKSTKAMQIDGVGCVVQVTTQQGDNVSEAVTFVPNVKIVTDYQHGGRMLVKIGVED